MYLRYFMIKVYPRPRGETISALVLAIIALGLSPPTRGNLAKGEYCIHRKGSIPAHAGKPQP